MDNAILYASFIKRIFSTNDDLIRNQLLTSSNAKIIRAISEIMLNIYHKNIDFSFSKHALRGFKKAKKDTLQLINNKTSIEKRRKLLIKNGKLLKGLIEIFK